MDGDWALNPLELMDMSCIQDRMAVRGAERNENHIPEYLYTFGIVISE